MNSIKSLIVITVLAAVTYGVYVSLNQPAAAPPPEGASDVWDVAPLAEMPTAPGPPVVGDAPAAGWTEAPPPAPVAAEAPPFASPGSADAPASAYAPIATPLPSADPNAAQPAAPNGVAASAPPFPDPAAASPFAPAPTIGADPGVPTNLSAPPVASPTASMPAAPLPSSTLPPTTAPAPIDYQEERVDYAATLQAVNTLLAQNQLAEAQLMLSGVYHLFGDPTLAPEQRQHLMSLLDQLTGTVIYSRDHLLEPAYTVQPGDTLQRIADQYRVPWQLLAKVNGIDSPEKLRIGDDLKVLPGPFSAFVELDQHRLTLWLNGRYAGRFAVGVGHDASTPQGEFAVLDKVENPTYYGPDRTIDQNDPANPLGERWIDLGNHIGIHGTNDLSSIGREESRGCIRLAPAEVEDVYDILSIGSRVYIQR